MRASFKNKSAVNSVILNNMNVIAFFGIHHSVKIMLIAVEIFYIIQIIDELVLKNCLRISYIKK